ncbi:DNA translocase FtsK [Anabaenopsis arnoldii]|uniref:DNA translocase FtsK n=1 Tax=Anabaenopsis arnoldii TaxID=2152938 RepID=A0ABT5AV96_9CYAN|nr:DNA translocase FtsK [Anabaenopsis arnoldii]MDB9541226.1 DNA translocase FtsK [Anabaenopsis arnoldii]MDH6093666.1 FtsK/SpoIIIE domain-containing protein [Anabaenopsis arnoldii]
MQYLTDPGEIKYVISELASTKLLWVDTEIADWYTQNPRLSLIQVLADSKDLTGVSAYILDVLDQYHLATKFINQIMVNSSIEKVFHNASFDLRYLGGELATNVTCTLKIARKITRERLQVSNLKLKTLASELCHFVNVDAESGASDWGIRPLSEKQLQYAAMDTVYLAAVHRSLLDMENNISEPVKERPSHPSLNPTKVRIAFECPRLFYLNHKFGDSAIFLPPDTPRGIGNHFHKLADELIKLALVEPEFQTLFEPESYLLNIEEVASRMQGIFYKLIFYPYLERVIQNYPDTVVILLKVWEGLQGLIKRFAQLLIANRSYCDGESLISQTFISGESSLEHYFTLPDGRQQRVRGEFDCLVFNLAKKRLCVVEFKTYQPVDPSAQLAQVSLYSYMLWQTKKVAVDASVYCVLPEFKEYQYSWEQLESTIHQLIPYKLLQMQQWLSWEPPQPDGPPVTTQVHLCEICPQQQKCGTFFSVVPENRDNQVTQDHTWENNRGESVNADAIGEDLVNTLQSFKVPVEYQGAAIGPAFIRVKLKPDLGVKVNAIMKLSADLQVHLGLERPPLIAPQAGYVSIDLPRPQRQVARFETYIQQEFLPPTVPIKIAMGVSIEGDLIEADLSDANTCHFLVGGTTGSGKSEFLRSLLLSLLYHHSPQHLKIALVDPKRVTFPEFEQIPWLYSPVVKDSDRAVELMEELVTEMESRYHKLENARCPDLITYNQNSPHPLPRIVCIFDEYADFMAEKAVRKVLELSIKRLGAMARAAGIHLIIATQRPEAGIVTPIIRSNLPGRIALRTASEADSKIVLGGTETSAAYLLGKGDLLYQIGAQMQRLQSLYAQKIYIPSF